MFKNQTRSRQLYGALGGRVGIITIILVIVIMIIIITWYIWKRIMDSIEEQDDFLRYKKLIKELLKLQRLKHNYDEDSVQFDMDRFKFTAQLIPHGNLEQNITWDTHSSTFHDLCDSLMSMTSFASDKTSKFYKNPLLWKQILFAIRTIAGKLPTKPKDYNVPWGTNWYQFSITYPTMLVSTAFLYYDTFGVEDSFLTRHLSSYIANYFEESPIVNGLKSMGWLRYESNVIGMSVPVIGGRLYSKRFNRNANSQIYARKYLAADYVYSGNGFYYDNTYITHESRNDGYTTSFYHEFKFIYDFYRMDTNFFKILHKNFSMTEHPDFPLHHGPWFNRGASMKGFAPGRKFARYGIDIRGFERSVCVRTPNISLHYSGQIIPLAAYESDRTNKEWGQCWIFMRRPITKTSAEYLDKDLVPYYDGVHSYGKIQIDWPSTTTTTETWVPDSALCSLCYIQDKAAGMYNKYKIYMANQFKFDIEEINLVTPQGFHVYYTCKVDTLQASSNPYTIACRLGVLDEIQVGRLTGVSSDHAYAFDDFIGTFLYLDDIDAENKPNTVFIDKVKETLTGKEFDALYVQPTAREVMKFGFSNNFYEYGSNERFNNLNAFPTMNVLSTDDFKLEKMNTDDAILILYNYRDNMAVVSYAFNDRLPQGIRIKKPILDSRFEKYDVVDGIFNKSTNEFTVNTYEKQYQIVLKNVVFK